MFDGTLSKIQQVWSRLSKKSYRDAFVASHLSTNIAAQISSMRESRKLSQRDLAEKTGMAQARISVMEDPSYENYSLSTLKRLASALDVALIVRFVPFSELAYWVATLSPRRMSPPSFVDDSLDHVLAQPSVVEIVPSKAQPAQTAIAGRMSITKPVVCQQKFAVSGSTKPQGPVNVLPQPASSLETEEFPIGMDIDEFTAVLVKAGWANLWDEVVEGDNATDRPNVYGTRNLLGQQAAALVQGNVE